MYQRCSYDFVRLHSNWLTSFSKENNNNKCTLSLSNSDYNIKTIYI